MRGITIAISQALDDKGGRVVKLGRIYIRRPRDEALDTNQQLKTGVLSKQKHGLGHQRQAGRPYLETSEQRFNHLTRIFYTLSRFLRPRSRTILKIKISAGNLRSK